MKYAFAGDCMVQEIFDTNYNGAKEITDFINKGDFRFFNLETTLNKIGSCPGSFFSGGSYLRADEKCLDSVLKFPFNVTSFNNNHAFDFTMDGFVSTLNTLKEKGLIHAGTGMDMDEASSPVYIEKDGKKSALISLSTTFDSSMMAGNISPNFKGRPGVNGVRFNSKVIVTEEQMNTFKQVAEQTGINAADDADRFYGYLPQLSENEFDFSGISLQVADKPSLIVDICEKDKKRIKDSILKAKNNANEVVVSIHTHEQSDINIEVIPDYILKLFRFCVDCGADIVVGHGPHLLRGIEIYKDKPIFYSIGNFIMQLNSIPEAPADFYEKYGLTPDSGIKKLLDVRSNGGKRGLMYSKVMFEAVVPFVEFADGKLKEIELLPVELGFDKNDNTRGLPRFAVCPEFMDRLQKLSDEFGTKIKNIDGKYFVEV